MKRLLLIVLVIGTAPIASGQTPGGATSDCRLTKAQAPVIRGLRLGLTVNQVLALFPGAERDERLKQQLLRYSFGFQYLSIVPSEYVVGDRFVGVKGVYLSFLDDRLMTYSLEYNGPEWKGTTQFASRVAEVLRLPNVESWKNVDGELGVVCDGFQLSVIPNRIKLKDLQTDVDKVVRERAEVPKEEARRSFKP